MLQYKKTSVGPHRKDLWIRTRTKKDDSTIDAASSGANSITINCLNLLFHRFIHYILVEIVQVTNV